MPRAAMIGLLATHHVDLVQILVICVPSTLLAVFIASLVQLRIGKELRDDPEYQKRLASGEVESLDTARREASTPLKAGSMTSALVFLAGVALAVLAGIFPELRTVPGAEKPLILSMPVGRTIKTVRRPRPFGCLPRKIGPFVDTVVMRGTNRHNKRTHFALLRQIRCTTQFCGSRSTRKVSFRTSVVPVWVNFRLMTRLAFLPSLRRKL
jgi:hypothetical protein